MDTNEHDNGEVYRIMPYKGNAHFTQRKTIFQYLQIHTATASMITHATGIPQKCICRYKRDLEKEGLLWETVKKACHYTGHRAWFLTTNPLLAPSISQLN